jgi:hypothetical protein
MCHSSHFPKKYEPGSNEQKREGKSDLAQYIANRGSKAVGEALTIGWELEEVEKRLERSKPTRIEVLGKKLEEQCADGSPIFRP